MTTVRCPNCEATYNIDPAKLENGGRKLKCARCQTVWLATAEPMAVAPAAAEVSPEPVVAAPEVPVAEDVPVQDEMPPVPEELIQRTPHVDAMVHVGGGWRRWLRGENVVWRSGAMILVVIGLLAGVVAVWRQMAPEAPVHEVTPEVVPVDGEAASRIIDPPAGVVLHRVRGEVSEIQGENGGVALTVRGLLANTTSATVVVPAMRLELLGADGKVADLWPVSGVSGTLAAQAEQAWTVSLTAPDMSSVKGWRVVFVK